MQQLNILSDIEKNEVIEDEVVLENDGWKKTTLGDLVTLNYGKSLPERDRIKGSIPVYSSSGLTGWHNKSITEEKSVIVGRKGSVGTVFYSEYPFFCIDTAYYIIENKEKYNLKYVYFLLKTLGLDKLNEDSAVPGLNRNTAYAQNFFLAPLNEQEQIAKILSSLDDKIELNQKMNKTLEEMAQAIFKHWFVDFEFPLSESELTELKNEQNLEGKTYKSSGGEMVDSELGYIPKGWKSGKFYELVDISSGKSIKRGEFIIDDGYPIIGANGEIGRSSKYLIDEEVFLTGRVGTLGTVFLSNEKIWPSDNVLISKSKNYYYYYYSYFTMKNFDFRSLNRGSTQPLITQSDIKDQNILISSNDILIKFDKILRPIFSKIKINIKQIIELTKIRDSLLPKLMSGDIRVNPSPNPFPSAFKGSKEGGQESQES